MNLLAGGESYRWKGNNVRSINIDGSSCAVLPRKDSYIITPISLPKGNKYRIGIVAKNGGGNNFLLFEIYGPGIIFEKIPIKISSSQFTEYWIDLKNINVLKTNIKISKSGKSDGTVILKKVEYHKIEDKKIEIAEEKEIKDDLSYQQEVGKAQSKIADEFRKNESKSILATRDNSMAIIGGNGYRWRGKGIRSIYRDGISCVELITKDSSVMLPVSIVSGGTYRITVTASTGGNGEAVVNFFGGKDFDGKQIAFKITSQDMKDYSITTTAPKFPSNLPIYLRLWRPEPSNGKICIKIIQYVKIEAPVVKNAKKIKRSSTPVVENKGKERVKVKKIVKLGDYDSMIFRPYALRKDSSGEVSKVLISKAEDVPKVSIITPTRDGIDLIKKCYVALVKNTAYPNWEWIVGDSESSDGTADYIKGLQDSRIKLIERGTTDGSFSSINNELTQFASGDYYLFLNNDTEPQQFWLYEMMSKIVRNNNVGIVGAKLIYNVNKIQHAGICFIPQGPANIGHNVLESFPKNFSSYDRYFQAVTGACLLMRASDFKSVGGFDPVYYFCYEDVDLCLKVRKQLGKKVLYAANAVVKHSESVTQKKYKTAGPLQHEGIRVFKERWMREIEIDFIQFQRDINKNVYKVDISFITCVNNMPQYRNYIIGSLFKSKSKLNYETIPILNFSNQYSAAQALNMGISKSRSNIVVLCHQDVIFYENWIDMLFERIKGIQDKCGHKWGVLGTAGITTKDDTYGVVRGIKGTIQWQSTKRSKFGEVQTVDEHCMILNKSSGLRFDEKTFNGFHFYGPDICLRSLNQGFKNFGILCPLVHDSASGSLASGKEEFMKFLSALAKKWRRYFDFIRTPTSLVGKRTVRTFVKFKSP